MCTRLHRAHRLFFLIFLCGSPQLALQLAVVVGFAFELPLDQRIPGIDPELEHGRVVLQQVRELLLVAARHGLGLVPDLKVGYCRVLSQSRQQCHHSRPAKCIAVQDHGLQCRVGGQGGAKSLRKGVVEFEFHHLDRLDGFVRCKGGTRLGPLGRIQPQELEVSGQVHVDHRAIGIGGNLVEIQFHFVALSRLEGPGLGRVHPACLPELVEVAPHGIVDLLLRDPGSHAISHHHQAGVFHDDLTQGFLRVGGQCLLLVLEFQNLEAGPHLRIGYAPAQGIDSRFAQNVRFQVQCLEHRQALSTAGDALIGQGFQESVGQESIGEVELGDFRRFRVLEQRSGKLFTNGFLLVVLAIETLVELALTRKVKRHAGKLGLFDQVLVDEFFVQETSICSEIDTTKNRLQRFLGALGVTRSVLLLGGFLRFLLFHFFRLLQLELIELAGEFVQQLPVLLALVCGFWRHQCCLCLFAQLRMSLRLLVHIAPGIDIDHGWRIAFFDWCFDRCFVRCVVRCFEWTGFFTFLPK
mmetsp:Transcript_30637/g.72275  ORF Transcript_30637/g.72275 Transcript_30637/m.72275 type:complete len:524 (+) Transcript_30637:632-2203(+)